MMYRYWRSFIALFCKEPPVSKILVDRAGVAYLPTREVNLQGKK